MNLRKILLVFLTVCTAFVCFACTNKVEKVNIAGASQLEVGKTATYVAVVTPSKLSQEVVWTVAANDSEKAEISASGVLTAKAVGKVNVIATAKDTDVKGELEVTIVEAGMSGDPSIAFVNGETEIALTLGKAVQYNVEITPSWAKQLLEWSVDKEELATINEKGVLFPEAAGKVKITASIKGTEAKAVLEVEIYIPDAVAVTITGPNKAGLSETTTYQAAIRPSTAEGNIVWTVDNPAVATISQTGVLTPKALGTVKITATLQGKDIVSELDVEIVNAVLANGTYDYQYASLKEKSEILAALEKWVLDIGLVTPFYAANAFTLYADRVTLLSETYVTYMGFGSLYGGVKTGTAAGTVSDPAYRNYTTATAQTLNMFMYDSSTESDILTLVSDSLFALDWNEDATGFSLYPSMASKLAEAAYYDEEAGKYVAYGEAPALCNTWLITLRDDLSFTNYKGEKVADITADDFIYSYQQLLDPKQKNTRADDVFFSSSFEIVGTRDYFGGKVEWSDVGIKKVDDYSFVFITKLDTDFWNFHYNTTSFLLGPVYKDLYEGLKNADGSKTDYGKVIGMTNYSKIDQLVFTGPYVLTYFEDGKEYRMTKNPNWTQNDAIPYDYKLDNIKTLIVADANAAIEIWKAGDLDVINIPTANLEEFISNPNLKRTPDATTWRFNWNALTQEQLYEVHGLTENDWKVSPLTSILEFRLAFSYAMNRNEIAATINKAMNAATLPFTGLYAFVDTVVDEEGNLSFNAIPYRQSDAGKTVTGYGFNEAKAIELYEAALVQLETQGVINSVDQQTLTIELALANSTTHVAMANYLKTSMEAIFNKQDLYPNITLVINIKNVTTTELYYQKQMVGKFDIAIGGISGGALDALSFMDTFFDTADSLDENFINTLQLTWGIDTNSVDILYDGKLWSFEALVLAACGETEVVNGHHTYGMASND